MTMLPTLNDQDLLKLAALWRLPLAEGAEASLPERWRERLSGLLPGIVHELWTELRKLPQLPGQLFTPEGEERFLAQHVAHWRRILEGRVDSAALEAAERGGAAHHALGLDPVLVLSSYGFVLLRLLRELQEQLGPRACAAVSRLVGGAGLDALLCLGAQLRRSCNSCLGVMRELEHLAYHDPLSGLPNRRLFLERLGQTLAGAREWGELLGLLRIDVDHFKAVNDAYGHDLGDRVLEQVGQRLRAVLRSGDTAARIGGDEFAVLLPELRSEADLVQVAERIVAAFADTPCLVGERRIHIGVSVGGALFPRNGRRRDELLGAADRALYRAKQHGRNRFLLAENGAGEEGSCCWIADFETALEQRQLELLFQPQVALDSGEVRGFEALLRWRHPHFGVLAPGRFLAALEQSPLMARLALWTLDRTCRAARQAEREHGFRGVFAVNFSQSQITMPGLLEAVRRTLARYGLGGGRLEIEVTEDSILEASGRNGLRCFHELKAMGVRIALDDFGTGYASLSHLRHLPVDGLKLDRSFVADLCTSERARGIAQTVIRLSRQIGAEVVAEGVEQRAQAEILARMGCDFAQGYLFGRPAPLARIGELLAAPAAVGIGSRPALPLVGSGRG